MNVPIPETRIARYVAEFNPASLTAADRHLVRRAILDTVACAVAGRQEPASVIAAGHVGAMVAQGFGGARVWSDGTVLPPELAAWRNGIEAHVLDYDDVASPLRGHPSVAILPALIALAETRDLPLAAVEEAYAVGFEILCRMAKAVAIGHYAKGWHSTATIGALAGALAAARLLGLGQASISNVLGIALAQISGTQGNFGTMAKSLQAGHAGQVAVRSALLAEVGFDGAPDALSGRQGFLRLYTDDGAFEGVFDDLDQGAPELSRTGIEIKKYPLCYATHRALDAAFDLLAEQPIDFDAIKEIEVACSNGAFLPLIQSRPQTGLEAKFSIEYAVAAALHDGSLGLAAFEDAAVQRASVQDLIPRVRVNEAQGAVMPRWAELRIALRDGSERVRRVEHLRGSAQAPLSDAELMAKVSDCFAFGKSRQAERFSAPLLFGEAVSARRLIDELACS